MNIQHNDANSIDIVIKIGDVFEPVKKIKNYKYSTTSLPETGKVPMFACKKNNSGIAVVKLHLAVFDHNGISGINTKICIVNSKFAV